MNYLHQRKLAGCPAAEQNSGFRLVEVRACGCSGFRHQRRGALSGTAAPPMTTSRSIAALLAQPSFSDGRGMDQTRCRCRIARRGERAMPVALVPRDRAG